MQRFFCTVLVAVCALPSCALALPNGAPWGSANPAVEPNCSSCHFDGEAVRESEVILLVVGQSGLKLSAGKTYDVLLMFHNSEAASAGFQISASAGEFTTDRDVIECNANEARSIKPYAGSGYVVWKLQWTAPNVESAEVTFYAAINSANDDASPFGDEIHYKSLNVNVTR